MNIKQTPVQENVHLCYLKGQKFIVFNYKNIQHCYSLSLFNNTPKYFLVQKADNKFPTVIHPYKKILLLKGLGIKASYNKLKSILYLKLGFSHISFIKVNPGIFIRIKKKFIFFQSLNKSKLGNIVLKIKNLKLPDAYKGKGIWYKTEKIKLKEVKKK
jgi:ribosomal protein L6P/L9E